MPTPPDRCGPTSRRRRAARGVRAAAGARGALALAAALGAFLAGTGARAWGGPAEATSASRPARPGPAPAHVVVGAADARVGGRAVVTRSSGLPEPGLWFSARALEVFDTPLGAGRGEYSSRRLTLTGRWARDLSSRVQVVTDLAFERGRYEFSAAAGLPGTGSLGGDVTGLRAGVTAAWSLSRPFGVVGGVFARSNFADGADLADGICPGVVGAVRLKLGSLPDVYLGAEYEEGLEGDSSITPVGGMGGGGGDGARSRWRIQARGAGVAIWYLLSPTWAVGLSGGYERRDIRLAPDDRLADGVLRERRLPIGVDVAWRRGERLSLSFSAGASLYNKVTLVGSDGREVLDVNTDPAPYVQLELWWHAG